MTTDLHFEVIRRIKEELENGRDYYTLHGRPVSVPQDPAKRPSKANLDKKAP